MRLFECMSVLHKKIYIYVYFINLQTKFKFVNDIFSVLFLKNQLRLSMLGKLLSKRHLEIFILFIFNVTCKLSP